VDITDYPADKLAELYIKIRDKRDALTRQYEQKHKELEEQLEIVADEMLELCKENGADSIKTPAGTIMRSVATRYWTNDWDSMYNFIKENDGVGLLEKRIHQTNMKQFLEENPDAFPPGMLVDSKYKIIVRRSKS
jgi:hypothetical protein